MVFSVLISTYRGDDPAALDKALESIYDQSLQPSEIVIVEDGTVPSELRAIINKWLKNESITTKHVKIEKNCGLGRALSVGLEHCTYDIVARMDSDDLAATDRFEKQIAFLRTNQEVDVVGGYMREIDRQADRSFIRKVPTEPEQVRSRARFRSPLNHPTVMFRKRPIENVGSYRDLRSMQDYDLWIRLLSNNYTIANIPDVLVETEVEDRLYERRGGIEYGKLEFHLQKEFLQSGFTSYLIFIFNLLTRIPIRLVPNRLRRIIYTLLLRDQPCSEPEYLRRN